MSTNPNDPIRRPAPAARPAAAPAPAQPAMAQQAQGAAYSDGYEEEEMMEEGGVSRFFMFAAVPSWMVSMLIHIVILFVLALIVLPNPIKDLMAKVDVDTTDLEEPEEDIEEPEEPEIDPDMPEVEAAEFAQDEIDPEDPVDVPANDPDMASIAVTLDEFGETTAPSSDMMGTIGSYFGTGVEGRGSAARAKYVRSGGGSSESEAAVQRALKWLAAHQNPDGTWNFNHQKGPCNGQCGNPGSAEQAIGGATAIAILPFLGAGQTHQEGEYKKTVDYGLAALIKRMGAGGKKGGWCEAEGTMYSHGLAAICLCEAYAMTNDKRLLGPAQSSIRFIEYAQDPVGGGWRYAPKQKGDTSVVGWQLMALKSAHMGYLEVNPEVIAKASKYLDSVQTDSGSAYGYTTPGRGEATTAIGLLCRMYLGWKHDHAALQRGVAELDRRGPSANNMYYNYYATQVMRHYGGKEWKHWNDRMRDWLISLQAREGHEEGSWFMNGGHGGRRGGRLYSTCMATMILEVYYRHLPIYKKAAQENDFEL